MDPRHTDFHTVVLMPPGETRNALALSLWDVGMLVTVFATPKEAEGVLVGENVHAVLLDARIGVIVGPALVSWLRAAGRGHVKVIIMGAVDAATKEQLTQQGAAAAMAGAAARFLEAFLKAAAGSVQRRNESEEQRGRKGDDQRESERGSIYPDRLEHGNIKGV